MNTRRSTHHRRTAAAFAVAGAAMFAVVATASGEPTVNAHFSASGTVALPGRGMSIAWSPSGGALALGGHFREKATGRRYDTRTLDVASRRLVKSFDCHYWWSLAQTWTRNPYLGEVIADGGGDHSVKIWNANSSGSTKCEPGQFRESDGGVHALYNINGWITSLAFSPDGRYLAGTSRDHAVRIWQIAPGPDQWKVVRAWFAKLAKQYLSVRWSPDSRRLVTGDRAGHVAEWSFEAADRWSEDAIATFAEQGWSNQPRWFSKNPALVARTPLWSEGDHKQIWNVRYSPNGSRIAAASTDGLLSVFEARTGRVVYRTHAPKDTSFYGLDWSPDGALLAVGAGDHSIYVFTAANGSLYDTLVGHGALVTAVAWSPNARTLASTAGGQLVSVGLNQVSDGPDNAVRFWARH